MRLAKFGAGVDRYRWLAGRDTFLGVVNQQCLCRRFRTERRRGRVYGSADLVRPSRQCRDDTQWPRAPDRSASARAKSLRSDQCQRLRSWYGNQQRIGPVLPTGFRLNEPSGGFSTECCHHGFGCQYGQVTGQCFGHCVHPFDADVAWVVDRCLGYLSLLQVPFFESNPLPASHQRGVGIQVFRQRNIVRHDPALPVRAVGWPCVRQCPDLCRERLRPSRVA